MSSGISSVAHHNLHINAIFVYHFRQELFVDKAHFFKCICMSDKPRLHQLNIITSSRSSTVQGSLTAWIFSFVRGNTIKEGEIPLRTNAKPHQFIKDAKIFIFHRLTCISQIFVSNLPKLFKPSAEKLSYSEYLKKYEPC